MKRGLIIDFNSVAALLAHEDACVQAEFLETFAKELNAICETRHAAEMQAVYISKELGDEAKELVKSLAYEEAE